MVTKAQELQEQVEKAAEELGLTVPEVIDAALSLNTGTSGEYDPSDFAIPYVTLVQANADAVKQRKAQAGEFVWSDGEKADFIDLVPLHIAYTRDFYDKEAKKNICGSRDRITGYPADPAYFVEHGLDLGDSTTLACKECPFYEWEPSPKMACKKGYTVTAFDLATESPFMFRVRGTAVSVFKNRLVGAIAMRGKRPWERQLQMTAALKSYNGNSWFAPELEPTKTFTKEEQAEWAKYAGGIVAPAPAEVVDHDDLPFSE